MASSLYTPAQLEVYLDHISFPSAHRPKINVETTKTRESLSYLSLLQKHHLATVPFENTALHYSHEKILSLNNDDLYEKIVVKKRGGYCMENNQLFGTVLKSFGFEVIASGARVFDPAENMEGWSHQINLVVIERSLYLVDVGFGGSGPTRPLPLEEDLVTPWGSTPASNRLVLQQASNPLFQPLWVLQARNSPESGWKSLYAFTLIEFFRNDFVVMNHGTSTRRQVFFTYKIIVLKMLLNDERDEVIGSVWIEGSRLKRRINGNTEDLKTFNNEDERVEAMREWFGLTFTQKERDGIRGTVTELREEN